MADVWFYEITPQEAIDQSIMLPHPGIRGPRTDGEGEYEFCPWPWEPIEIEESNGQYLCSFCGSVVVSGTDHLDYDLPDDGSDQGTTKE